MSGAVKSICRIAVRKLLPLLLADFTIIGRMWRGKLLTIKELRKNINFFEKRG